MHVRTLFAVGLAALLAAPSIGSAQAKKGTSSRAQASRSASTTPASKALSLGGFVGYEWGDADGFQLRVDGELPLQQLSPQVLLSFVGSVGYTFGGYDVPGLDVSVNRLKIVPAARFTIPLNPQFSIFGDAGLGLHYTSVDFNYDFFGIDASDSDLSFMLRFGAGAFFNATPRMRVGGSLVVDPMFGDYDDTTFSILVGLMYQL